MNMGMVREVLSPGVEHGEEADLSTPMSGMGSDLEQRLRGGRQEKRVDKLGVLQGSRCPQLR